MVDGALLLLLAPLLLALIALSALFSAIETALFSLQPFQLVRLKTASPPLAAALELLMDNPRRLLSVVLLADALVNIPLILLSLFLLQESTAGQVPFWAKAGGIFGLIVLACDMMPKLAALTHPVFVSAVSVRVVNSLHPILDPTARVLQRISEHVAAALLPSTFQPQRYLSEEELETLVQLGAEEGTLAVAESAMIQEIIKLGDKTAKDCMTPRTAAFAVPDDLTNEEVIPRLIEQRYRRVPIYAESPDNVLGVLDVKAFLHNPSEHYAEVMSPPSFVAETMQALDLLRSFLKHPQRMAIIVDEHGGTEGLVTLTDIIEEIIGEAVPTGEAEQLIEHIGDGRLIVHGSVRLDDLGERLGVSLEREGLDTIGGLVFNHFGYAPSPGATIRIDDLVVTVRRITRRQITELLIVENPVDQGTNEDRS